MKNIAKFLPFVLAALAVFLIPACRTDTDLYPDGISGRTAFEFFREEGITIGWNLGNTLDAVNSAGVAVETGWGNPAANQAIFNGLRDQGFNLVRIPVTWAGHIGAEPDHLVCPGRMDRVAAVVGLARNAGLNVVINIHHDGRTYSPVGNDQTGTWLSVYRAARDPVARAQITRQFERVWEQIAARFINHGEWLMFQGFNELHVGDWGTGLDRPDEFEVINEWNQVFTNAVRSTGGANTYRFLIYSGYNTSFQTVAAYTQGLFVLPDDPTPNRRVINFHFYQPNNFALFRTNPNWPPATGSGSIEGISNTFAGFRETFVDNGIPVIIGEIGPVRHGPVAAPPAAGQAAPPVTDAEKARWETARANRLHYIEIVYAMARENGLVPIYWDNGSLGPLDWDSANIRSTTGERFGLFNRANGQPNSEESAEVIRAMIDAINSATPPWN
ncbi:MAG: glycoside hydrolase family 5 protein [Treponema sp.]|nr:glycoside hydrolase family 5 protein [Treponema sp.]